MEVLTNEDYHSFNQSINSVKSISAMNIVVDIKVKLRHSLVNHFNLSSEIR